MVRPTIDEVASRCAEPGGDGRSSDQVASRANQFERGGGGLVDLSVLAAADLSLTGSGSSIQGQYGDRSEARYCDEETSAREIALLAYIVGNLAGSPANLPVGELRATYVSMMGRSRSGDEERATCVRKQTSNTRQ